MSSAYCGTKARLERIVIEHNVIFSVWLCSGIKSRFTDGAELDKMGNPGLERRDDGELRLGNEEYPEAGDDEEDADRDKDDEESD